MDNNRTDLHGVDDVETKTTLEMKTKKIVWRRTKKDHEEEDLVLPSSAEEWPMDDRLEGIRTLVEEQRDNNREDSFVAILQP